MWYFIKLDKLLLICSQTCGILWIISVIMTLQWLEIIKTILSNKLPERYFDNGCTEISRISEIWEEKKYGAILMFFNLIVRNAPLDYFWNLSVQYQKRVEAFYFPFAPENTPLPLPPVIRHLPHPHPFFYKTKGTAFSCGRRAEASSIR